MHPSLEITDLLINWSNGDKEALDRLFPLIEAELHRLARHYMRRFNSGNTLQTTALINETYINLVDQKKVQWQNRAHFFGISARIMRRILLRYVRDRKRVKRGGDAFRISLTDAMLVSTEKSDELLALEAALSRFERIDERKARIVELRYFGGLSVDETAEVMKISKTTVMRDWRMAKAWLAREIRNAK